MRITFFISILLLNASLCFSNPKDTLIQFSGLVMTSDSLEALPFAHIYLKESGMGTITNFQGFFSLIVQHGDTVVFRILGYKTVEYRVPNDLKDSRYSVVQLMSQDTFYLDETIIYPWPSREQFREAFLTLNIPDDDLERAKKNLERERLREMGEILPYDAGEMQDFYARAEKDRYYYYGQVPPQNIFNPIAWGKFIEAWKRGDFKKK